MVINKNLVCYIVHYSKLTDRKEYMLRQLKESGLNNYCEIIWVDKFDREVLTEDQINKYSHDGTLSTALVGNAISNVFAFKDIVTQQKVGLIIDDDIIFHNDFVEKLESIVCTLKSHDWDLIFLATVCNIHGRYVNNYHAGIFMNYNLMYNYDSNNIIKGDSFSLFPSLTSRGGSGVLVNIETAKKLLTTIIPFSCPIDLSYTTEIHKHSLKTYFVEPVIADQGSETIFNKSYI